MANGGWILSSNKPVLDGSYAYNRDVAVLAESIGLDFIMAMAKWRGYGGVTEHWRYSLESQMLMAALATQTQKVKVWATVHTLLQNPVVAAKMITTLDHISGGRAGLNIVTGSYKGEFEMMHAWRADVGHDERYDLATDWIRIIKSLWADSSTNYEGKYFSATDAESFPKPIARPRPFLVCAGTSRRGMQFTVQETDAIFLGGATAEEMGKNSRAAKAMARDYGRTIKTYTMLNLVIGETDAEAKTEADHYRAGFDEEAFKGMLRAYGMIDTEIGRENAFTAKARSGFMAEHVLGSPDTITDRIGELLETCDLDGLMLIFPDYLKGLRVFGDQILPKLRSRFPSEVTA
jgi:pyrimidine oxygenase